MKIFKDKHCLKKEILFSKGISFIPTMGNLHEGHISLIREAKKFNLKVLVSIYVNPKQFNNKSDFKSYPRKTKKDMKLLRKLKIDYLYMPSFKDVFGFKTQNKIYLDKSSKKLCGKFRIGHFKGVINVVNRFLEIIKPKYLFLGKKDYQQLFLIKKHIKKRKINTKIIECNTVRDKNGVACSSRNSNLNTKQLKIASKIYKLNLAAKIKLKKRFRFSILNKLKENLNKVGIKKLDYVEIYNIKKFKKLNKSSQNFNIFIAYYLGEVRLIDNI